VPTLLWGYIHSLKPADDIRMRLMIFLLLFGLSSGIAGAEPLVLQRTIALKGVSGRIDHMAIDAGRKRLFVAELGNSTLDVIDLEGGQVIDRISGLKEPQGAGYAPESDILAIANGGDGSVRLFHGADLSAAGVVALGDDADNVRFDPASGNFIVGYGSGGLATIDPRGGAVLSRIRLPAHPESFQIDAASRRAYVNVPGAQQIAVFDLKAGQAAAWRVPGLAANFPLALDEAGGTVASVFRSPPRLVLLDAHNGNATSNLASCGDADDVFFDNRRRRLYVSCGEGRVDVWQQDGTGYRRVGSIRTASGARTSLFVPTLDRLYVAARAGFFGLGSDAAILEFRPIE
jgi:DNA-binding beta-propeller fold protein YncE